MNNQDILKAIFLLILAIYIGYSFFKRAGNAKFKNILLWGIIFFLLILAYAFRFELEVVKDRVISVLIPSRSWTNDKGQLVIARSGDGHFYLDAKGPGGQNIHFLVDTGASDIALTQEDAIKLGFDPKKLNYTRRYNTANGVAYAAPIKIKQLTVGKRVFYNVEAHVSSAGLDISLLGMSLIEDFSNFKITKDMLILDY